VIPLVEYQREGFALYQSMMGQIREESVGFLFNLEVEVTGGEATAAVPTVAAKGLSGNAAPVDRLSYSAPNADNQGEVEVRNSRGQLDRASTAKAQEAREAQDASSGGSSFGKAATAEGQRGAFGQAGAGAAPANRAERRAQEKRKG
jgi:preprotein translocase subunit SecA